MKAGDHIRITRGGVSEHAIEIGDQTVVHFAKGEGVKRSRLGEVAPGGAKVEVVVHRHRVYAPKQVVARALSRFSDSAHSAVFRDSEDFAYWCKTGRTPARSIVPHAALAREAAQVAATPARAAAAPARVSATPARTRRPVKARGPAKVRRPAKPSAPAKRAAAPKPARGAKKKITRARAPAKPTRSSRSKGKRPKRG